MGYKNMEASNGIVPALLGMTSHDEGWEFSKKDVLVTRIKLLMVMMGVCCPWQTPLTHPLSHGKG